MKKNILIILLSIFVLGCSSDDDNPEMTNIESTLIAKDNLYGNGMEGITQQNLIISDQTAWNDLIAQMNSVNNVSDNFTETYCICSLWEANATYKERYPTLPKL